MSTTDMMSNKRTWRGALLLLACSSLVVGCGDSPPIPGTAQVRFLHASYDAPPVSIKIDNGAAISSVAYGTAAAYLAISSELHGFVFTDTTGEKPKLLDSDINAAPLDYTVYLLDAADKLQTAISTDDRAVVADKAKVRFVQASPDAPAVDLRIDTFDGKSLATNVAFSKFSSYSTVDEQAYKLVLSKTPEKDVDPAASDVLATFEPFTFEKGKVYTVIALGTTDAADVHAFMLRVFTDNGDGTTSTGLLPEGTSTKAHVRVIHGSYDAGDVDVQVDGSDAFTGLVYGTSSGYAEVDGGDRKLTVVPAGGGTALIDATETLAASMDYTVLALDAKAKITHAVATDARQPVAGKAKVRFIHASPDAPAVDIKTDSPTGTALFAGAAFKSVSDYKEVDVKAYTLVVTEAGKVTPLYTFDPVSLADGKVYTIVALGTVATADGVDFVVRVFDDTGDGKTSTDLVLAGQGGKARLMFVHASPDATNLDLLVDTTKLTTAAIAYAQNTGYLDVAAGSRKVVIQPSAGGTALVDKTYTFNKDKDYTLVVTGLTSAIGDILISDDLGTPTVGQAKLRFIHAAPTSPTVDLLLQGTGTPIFAATAFKAYTAFKPLQAAANATLEIKDGSTVLLTVPNVALLDGKVLTLLFHGDTTNKPLAATLLTNK